MDAERFSRLERLFQAALELPTERLDEYLARACGTDAELRRDVERLLAADTRAQSDIESFDLLASRADTLVGRRLGPWRILERIAEGGMGVVYRAERADGLFERQVAVKLLRFDVATGEALQRFEQERRTLARLEHPNIALLLDGGRSEAGTPYLVMELVDGLAIDRWCDERELPIDERLRLFAAVCRAVHFAHQNLVVHRDLKPSNVMVDQRGAPKLLDFGIARLLQDSENDATRTIARALTPRYASPEQLQGLPLTTATDVYSLGVVLYELLTGRGPWQREGRSAADWENMVSREQPTRPSTAVLPADRAAREETAAIAARRDTTPVRLKRRLRGDLDRIVLMALRKEPERRYASAEQFAEDLERYLANLPVRARRDTLGYRALRFSRRNRTAIGAAAAVLVALLIGLIASLRAAERARVEEARARRTAEHARIEAESFSLIARLMGDTLLRGAQDGSSRAALADELRRYAAQVRVQHADHPHLRANLLDALGQSFAQLERFDEARALLLEARDVRLATFGERTMEHALSLGSLGQLEHRSGHYAEAAEHLALALALHRERVGEVHSDVALAANDLAASLHKLGRFDEAQVLHEEALDLRRAAGADSTLVVAESLHNLALVLLDRRENERARELVEEALAIRSRILGSAHALTLQTVGVLGGVAWRLGDQQAAERHLRAAVDGYRELGAGGSEGLGVQLGNLAALQLQRGDLDAAALSAGEALEVLLALFGPDHPRSATARTRVAGLHQQRGERAAAREAWREVLRVQRATYPAEHPLIASTLNQLANACLEDGLAEEA
ncbi:MAG TPA: serine/threonine-protein kinase, partial [Planctomycetota bacterium]|nr:serine/threonine-protein kinase [Planctomycetota bacterium]